MGKKLTEITRFDLGCTEDEWNNFMIDMFDMIAWAERAPIAQFLHEPITITITTEENFLFPELH